MARGERSAVLVRQLHVPQRSGSGLHWFAPFVSDMTSFSDRRVPRLSAGHLVHLPDRAAAE